MNIDSNLNDQHLSSLSSTKQVEKTNSLPQQTNANNVGSVKNYAQTSSQSIDRANEQVDGKESPERIPREQLEALAEKLHEFVGGLNKGLEFSVHEDSGRDVIKVIDRDTKEVVRQYPSEEVLELVSKLSDAAGNFINSQA